MLGCYYAEVDYTFEGGLDCSTSAGYTPSEKARSYVTARFECSVGVQKKMTNIYVYARDGKIYDTRTFK